MHAFIFPQKYILRTSLARRFALCLLLLLAIAVVLRVWMMNDLMMNVPHLSNTEGKAICAKLCDACLDNPIVSLKPNVYLPLATHTSHTHIIIIIMIGIALLALPHKAIISSIAQSFPWTRVDWAVFVRSSPSDPSNSIKYRDKRNWFELESFLTTSSTL